MNSAKIDPLDAELLLAHVLRKPREWVLTHPEARVGKYASIQVSKLFKKRALGIPLAYLTGHKEFFGLDFGVNKNVLIPRPDTEVLVTSALEHLRTLAHGPVTLIDVGTGSGCIPIAIAKHICQSGLSGNLDSIIAIDISKQALNVAKRNAKKHGVKIKFLHGNLLSPITNNRTMEQWNNRHIIITANLPYLTKKQYQISPTIQHEPKLALVAKNNGLALYKKLLKQIRKLLEIKNLKLEFFLEIDPSQSKSITSLIKSILPNAKIEIKKDLSGLDRIVKVAGKGL
ncbi:peptide chain release factor N(5)-glutamine methyltransferase [Candidatus Peregrinibacteria bacterium]|nr:peptide chain release factor N(5)-glutamine methyltransferase [Candidatus Peregrinibacteria bacterium]